MASTRRNTHHSVDLPTEIWVMVIQLLDQQDREKLRLVNHELLPIATLCCFETVTFDLSEAGMEKLIQIASSKHLAENVRTLQLKRPRRMPEIIDFNEWMGFFVDVEEKKPFHYYSAGYDGGWLAYEGWSRYTRAEHESLYEQYKDKRNKTQDNLKSLLRRLYHTNSDHCEQLSFKDGVIGRLSEACRKFTKLTSFKHKPGTIWDDRWVDVLPGKHREFQDDEYESQEDDDIEALNLAVALSVMVSARKHISKLQSITFHTRGPLFWILLYLKRLQQGHGHNDVRAAEQHMGQELLNLTQYNQQFDTMKEALRDISSLDCSVSEKVHDGGLSRVTGPFLEFLCCCQKLRKLSLTFGHLEEGDLRFDETIGNQHDAPKALLTSLARSKPWSKIGELRLRIVTDQHSLLSFLNSISDTLHHLTLSNIHFGRSKGTWESALVHLASELKNLKKWMQKVCVNGAEGNGKQEPSLIQKQRNGKAEQLHTMI
ncbi:hypothetical protein J3E72DRAFT_380098 [Bipolaris maydis]|nr:hypothetical protein J3E74DRAFT_412157 [Bipolaris maydis]KAJ6192328.1 hypothetical protein J3E72DRAFT_380098 [Bipolaris maydis]